MFCQNVQMGISGLEMNNVMIRIKLMRILVQKSAKMRNAGMELSMVLEEE